MSSSFKQRVLGSICVGVILFMLLSIVYKLLDFREDWLSYSATWAISWAIGRFIGTSISESVESIGKIFIYEMILIFIVVVVMTFIIGVVIGLPTWKDLIADICIPFGLSILISTRWIRD